jgi:phosphomevalonate kinase
LKKVPQYAPLGSSITKTGLGSSAALVSSVTACILSWAFGWTEFGDEIHLAHNVAQAAHCQAQGKIGSGFDVASAFFGSQHYIRFSRTNLDVIMTSYASYKADNKQILSFLDSLKVNIGEKWLKETPPSIALPRGLTMILGECGKDMNTPTSVKQVLDWAAKNTEASDELFAKLSANNLFIIETMKLLTRESLEHVESYDAALNACKKYVWREWQDKVEPSQTRNFLTALQSAFKLQRGMMKQLGMNANTPVEPDEITRVLDKTEEIEGVLATGAPGAGGYDAVFTILIDSSITERVESAWLDDQELPMSCMLTEESSEGASIKRYISSPSSCARCPFSYVPTIGIIAVTIISIGMIGMAIFKPRTNNKK